jgi:signal transduction histidine kinase
MERSDREDALEGILDAAGIDAPWKLVGPLVDGGYTADDLHGLPVEHAESLIRAAAARAECESLLAEVSEGASRLSALVGALKSYSFHDQAPIQDVDVIKGIEDTILILRSKLRDVDLVRDYDDIGTITAYGSQLNQVWTNLIDNAIDAIRDGGVGGGRIVVRASEVPDGVEVQVENTGPAIPDEVRDRMFEAFFTTKEPGRGTGLGLDTVYNIVVTQHRGSIDVESEEGRTVFTVTLPRTADSPLPDD